MASRESDFGLASSFLLSFHTHISSVSLPVAIDEDNEMDGSIPRANNYDNLTELHKHQAHHRELFLSRQIETYKIDMVR